MGATNHQASSKEMGAVTNNTFHIQMSAPPPGGGCSLEAVSSCYFHSTTDHFDVVVAVGPLTLLLFNKMMKITTIRATGATAANKKKKHVMVRD